MLLVTALAVIMRRAVAEPISPHRQENHNLSPMCNTEQPLTLPAPIVIVQTAREGRRRFCRDKTLVVSSLLEAVPTEQLGENQVSRTGRTSQGGPPAHTNSKTPKTE